ncbi:vitamin B12 ABC transporter substrate-binding protein BtuF [Vibrio sp. SCSIO 43136]|uniref:vitamin B12 ABC transporter substrate-binding protein BtuF n=1 Tax=Vibrio sp. SCSIO 43136 TaxID=2819101 RepID=UPI00207639CC|nr:vitamin B12 ABC transporter substrate-binding protein BtuF [Vibrio sp. SCSIO 43136]USD65711.1 vitamin B12 ABC transporter substrate-binding protein BtuF [Vibrio sp. SCSIO 43136]
MFRAIILGLILMSASTHADVAKRVISLSPHATELAFTAGLGKYLVGVSERSDYPEQANHIERVANYQGIKLERIIALKPDLIVVWKNGNPSKEIAKLEQLGFNIEYTETGSLEQIASNIERLSQYSENPKQGMQAAQDFRDSLAALKQKYQVDKPVRFFYQLNSSPIMTVAKGAWPSDVFKVCGGENVFENAAASYPQVGKEQVILAAPEVIFFSRHGMAHLNTWSDWPQIPAVADAQLWSLNASWINRPTLRTLKAIEEVCDYFEQARLSKSQ